MAHQQTFEKKNRIYSFVFFWARQENTAQIVLIYNFPNPISLLLFMFSNTANLTPILKINNFLISPEQLGVRYRSLKLQSVDNFIFCQKRLHLLLSTNTSRWNMKNELRIAAPMIQHFSIGFRMKIKSQRLKAPFPQCACSF